MYHSPVGNTEVRSTWYNAVVLESESCSVFFEPEILSRHKKKSWFVVKNVIFSVRVSIHKLMPQTYKILYEVGLSSYGLSV